MKIIELRFKNLNSLYGEWKIDFTDPEYVSNGIFALTGPTGAGKSTILDAVCLALYGATPRLGKISKSTNEIMSRQTGECYAEVVFESQTGRFRCHWEQWRSRKKADGSLQSPEHQIAHAESGEIIESKKSLVSGVIEEKTGMDFDRFTRSILLAQGGFDTFLRADAEQKSKILEQITGTEIYSEISRRVHERQRDEREKLNLLQAETSGIVVLGPEQEQEIKLELEGKRKQEAELACKLTETEKAVDWLNGIENLKKKIVAISEEEARLQFELEAFKPQRDKLARALKAAALDGRYSVLLEVRKQRSNDKAALEEKIRVLPELEKSVKEQGKSVRSLEQLTIRAKEELKAEALIIKKVRPLDQELDKQRMEGVEYADACKKDEAKIEEKKKESISEQKRRSEEEYKLNLVNEYLAGHSSDEWLISGLAGIEEQLKTLASKQEEIAGKVTEEQNARAELRKADQKLEECTKQHFVRKQDVEDAAKKLRQGKEALDTLLDGRLLREYRTEKETLLREKAFLEKIAELEGHRAKLEDGKPCPLCGAEEHPYAEGNVPIPDETEKKIDELTQFINNAEEQEASIRKLEETEISAAKDLAESEKNLTEADHRKISAERMIAELKSGMEKIRGEIAELQRALSAKLQPFGHALDLSDPKSTMKTLYARMTEYQAKEKEKISIEKVISDLDSSLKQLDVFIETQSSVLAEKQQKLELLRKKYAEGVSERKKLYGDKNPDTEESRLEKAVYDAEQAQKQARVLYDELQTKLTSTKTDVDSLRNRIGQQEEELKKLNAEFTTEIQYAGFADEKDFVAAMLSPEDRDGLASEAKKLDDRETHLKARQREHESDLVRESDRKITEKTLEELQPQFKELEEALKQLRDAIAALNHKLSENVAAKERIKEKQTVIEAQKKECLRWDKLHSLIGSADGKKYRNFAQGLTFELMVAHANRQLEKMTDRYLLIRDTQQPLELNVIDNYQAGEIRSTRNLSGGESFIVSLTLALGLSKMASRKVRVDSLFLDEGFGTLDEEALETALETLSGLQQDGKLIGIISHVSALKERISTQIKVTPASNGRSTLSGPGCDKGVGRRRTAECEESQVAGATV
ncbi:MAG: AAA family ATPase [Chitinispirillaceae bacterium]